MNGDCRLLVSIHHVPRKHPVLEKRLEFLAELEDMPLEKKLETIDEEIALMESKLMGIEQDL